MPRDYLAAYTFKELTRQELIYVLSQLEIRVYDDNEDRTRFKCEFFIDEGNYIKGIFKYGKYGKDNDVEDQNGKVVKQVASNESLMDEYYFLFYYPIQNANSGIAILQRIGNVGIRTAFTNAVKHLGRNFIAEPVNIFIREFLENGDIFRIKIKIPYYQFLTEDNRLDNFLKNLEVGNIKYTEINLTAERNGILSINKEKLIEILDTHLNQNKEGIFLVSDDEDISVEVRIGGNIRTINITKGKVRTWIPVNYDKICEEALSLAEEIYKRLNEVD